MIEDSRQFGYDFGGLWAGAIGLAAAGGYVLWRESVVRLEVGILVGAALFLLVTKLLPLCSVVLTESEIEVKFLLPFRHGGVFRHEEIANYAEVVFPWGKRQAISGMLQPKEGKAIMLSGTRNFQELNAILREIYPEPEKKAEAG